MNLQYTFDVTYNIYIIQYNNMIIKEKLTNFYGSFTSSRNSSSEL